MYSRPWPQPGERLLGAWIGAALPAFGVGVLLVTDATLVGLVFAPAIPLGAGVGARLAPRIVAAPSPIGAGLRAGAIATAVGTLGWIALEVAWTLAASDGSVFGRLVSAGFLSLLVVLYAVFLGLPIALPVGVAAAALLRVLLTRPALAIELLGALSFAAAAMIVAGIMAAASG